MTRSSFSAKFVVFLSPVDGMIAWIHLYAILDSALIPGKVQLGTELTFLGCKNSKDSDGNVQHLMLKHFSSIEPMPHSNILLRELTEITNKHDTRHNGILIGTLLYLIPRKRGFATDMLFET